MPELRCPYVGVLYGGSFDFFRRFRCEAVSPIVGDRSIDDRSAVNTFPRIEGQEEIREAFQHHQSFALRAFHDYSLPHCESELARGESNLRSKIAHVALSIT